jgi:membrane protein DedA with SNARE-associated domain
VSNQQEKIKFLASNLARGLLWLVLLIGGFIVFKNYIDVDYLDWLQPVYERSLVVYGIYTTSEVLFGIIPPEIFMMWGLRTGHVSDYASTIVVLMIISYLAGVIGFMIGRYFERTQFFKVFKKRVFGKYEKYLSRFGAFIIIVASLTPLPFSGVSMLIGSVDFPFRKYLLFALFRFVRFAAYSYIIWQANSI